MYKRISNVYFVTIIFSYTGLYKFRSYSNKTFDDKFCTHTGKKTNQNTEFNKHSFLVGQFWSMSKNNHTQKFCDRKAPIIHYRLSRII